MNEENKSKIFLQVVMTIISHLHHIFNEGKRERNHKVGNKYDGN